MEKNPAANAGDVGSIPGLGRSPGEGHDNPLQYSCLENPTNSGGWQAIVHGVANSLDMTEHVCAQTHTQRLCGRFWGYKLEHVRDKANATEVKGVA